MRRGITTGLMTLALLGAKSGHARPFTFETPAGPITIEVSHVGPSGDLVSPPAPAPLTLRPPSIFSAPLPTGSGARALGLAGAFTALADDATAASWNPAGLVQLETPEASMVYRMSKIRAAHQSDSDKFKVGSDQTDEDGLNYFSLAYPFYIKAVSRNAVVSLNHQEAYDFGQHFHADLSQAQRDTGRQSTKQTFTSTQTQHTNNSVFNVDITSHLVTDARSSYSQIQDSDLISKLDFDQSGVISALSPAFAIDLSPTLSVGAALNWYQNDPLSGDAITSHTVARYNGKATGDSSINTVRTTSGSYSYSGTMTTPPPFSRVRPISGQGPISAFSDTATTSQKTTLLQDGVYDEKNRFTELDGFNQTLGVIWTLNWLLTFGASVDLPWTASARQTKTVSNSVTTYDASHTKVLDVSNTTKTGSEDVEFNFPLFWNIGFVLRWMPQLYSTFDVGQTKWSDFSFQAAGGPKINPLNSQPLADSPLDDTWSWRAGTEYLIKLKTTQIPLRIGFAREERPALEHPDIFYTATCGTGISLGKEDARTVLDIAYGYTWAGDVRGIVPDQPGLTSDVHEQQIFVSIIQHF